LRSLGWGFDLNAAGWRVDEWMSESGREVGGLRGKGRERELVSRRERVPRRSEDRKVRAIYYWAIVGQGRKMNYASEERTKDVSVKQVAVSQSRQCSAALAVFALHQAEEFLRDWLID